MKNVVKKLLRNLFAGLLALLARAALRKYKPKVVMVTGSVGKTSTKDAVAAALSGSWKLRASEKSYNSEFGVPLTILGAKNPWTSPARWIKVYIDALVLLIFPHTYPKLLVLEVGADRPGDLARILKIATPDAVVLTRLPEMPVHIEAYATPDAVREEEFAPAYALAPDAPLIYSADDVYARNLAKPLQVKPVSFGSAPDATVRVGEPELWVEDEKPVGMRTQVEVNGASESGETHPLTVRGALGAPQLLAPAAALATAVALGVKPADALKGLESYVPPPGRARILKGREDALLIDDTYNASPAAVEEALATLALIAQTIPGTRRIALLGDMLELGRYSHEAHARIGTLAAQQCDVLVTVGPRALAIAETARAAGMPEEQVHSFDTSNDAAREISELLRPTDKDAILLKGSQSIRMERIVEALLADPADAKLLVRQEAQWKRR